MSSSSTWSKHNTSALEILSQKIGQWMKPSRSLLMHSKKEDQRQAVYRTLQWGMLLLPIFQDQSRLNFHLVGFIMPTSFSTTTTPKFPYGLFSLMEEEVLVPLQDVEKWGIFTSWKAFLVRFKFDFGQNCLWWLLKLLSDWVSGSEIMKAEVKGFKVIWSWRSTSTEENP